MQRLVISAPFGNYFNCPGATSTLGTFTKDDRGGWATRLWRLAATVRYYHGIRGFKNRMRLPNRGIDWLSGNVGVGRIDPSDKIVSISARDGGHWNYLLGACYHLIHPAYVELNVSCPNCPGESDYSDYESVFADAVGAFPDRVIVKLPPVGYLPIARRALRLGVTGLHCCNTLPTPGGGLSGKPLKPLSLQACRDIRELVARHGHRLDILIGGGGVTGMADADDYFRAGASSVSVASVLFWPWRWRMVREMAADFSTRDWPPLRELSRT